MKPNQVTALDAVMALLLHIGGLGRRASEPQGRGSVRMRPKLQEVAEWA